MYYINAIEISGQKVDYTMNGAGLISYLCGDSKIRFYVHTKHKRFWVKS